MQYSVQNFGLLAFERLVRAIDCWASAQQRQGSRKTTSLRAQDHSKPVSCEWLWLQSVADLKVID